jgi:hypothetical protein
VATAARFRHLSFFEFKTNSILSSRHVCAQSIVAFSLWMRNSFTQLVLLFCLAAAVHVQHAKGAATVMKVGDNLKDSPEYNRCGFQRCSRTACCCAAAACVADAHAWPWTQLLQAPSGPIG